jgi:Bacterial sugar transferase
VLTGEMAMVGPRATLAAQVALYSPRQRRRLELKPGVTGWAQTHGRAGIPWEERIELDVWYVENRSLGLDLKILALTPLVLLKGTGISSPDAYAGSSVESPLRQAAERERELELRERLEPREPRESRAERD